MTNTAPDKLYFTSRHERLFLCLKSGGVMSEETGGPAFPQQYNESKDARRFLSFNGGMTIRDYFAAKAMQGDISFDPLSPGATDEQLERYANHYYKIADAMLKARSQ